MPDEPKIAARADGRADAAIRPIEILPHWTSTPAGSALVKLGRTWILATVSLEARVPKWRMRSGRGWLTASYNLLPGSTEVWTPRDRTGANGRTHEIERLIGRSLRAAIDVDRLPEATLHVDCEVLQADGGTRTAAITGGWVALALAVRALSDQGRIRPDVLRQQVAAVSVGIVDGRPMVDLAYAEDVRAHTDMNVVMTAGGGFIEVQGTAEKGLSFDRAELDALMSLAEVGIRSQVTIQSEVLHAAGR